jgi:hypothetical protein
MKKGIFARLVAIMIVSVFTVTLTVSCSVAPTKFNYIITEEDYDFAEEGEELTMTIVIRKVGSEDWTSYDMTLDSEAGDMGEFNASVDLKPGMYEYYFEINGSGLDMKDYCEGWYTPEAVNYTDDGIGSFNAIFEVK